MMWRSTTAPAPTVDRSLLGREAWGRVWVQGHTPEKLTDMSVRGRIVALPDAWFVFVEVLEVGPGIDPDDLPIGSVLGVGTSGLRLLPAEVKDAQT